MDLPALLSIVRGASGVHLAQGQRVRRFSNLALFIDQELHAHAVLDGEVVCFDAEGRARFSELMFGRGDPAFVASDVLARG
jgi:hypothetical protein